MQFGLFSVSDVTLDPTTGKMPTERERIKAAVAIAKHAEDVGLDVYAIGEHHNPPFFSSSPTTLLGYIAAATKKLILSTSTTLITTNDPVKIAEDYAMLQHLSDGIFAAEEGSHRVTVHQCHFAAGFEVLLHKPPAGFDLVAIGT